jgi:predicted RNase H-like nuclease
MTERVLGVDACAAGWVGIALTDQEARAHVAGDFQALVAAVHADGPLDVVAVDMPIGLPDAGLRRADVLARAVVGPRRSSVFMTPIRAAMEAPDYVSALAINKAAATAGISRQAFGLRPKLFQVERYVRATRLRVVEVHPEVSFATLAGGPVRARKSTWAGAMLRRRLLAEAGIAIPDDLGVAGHGAGVDDVLDAAAAAWTGRRVSRGESRPMPDPPETFSDGLSCAIWA